MIYNLPFDDWEPVGLELGISHSTLTTIKKNNQCDVNAQKREMFSTWLRQDVHASYGKLVEALRKTENNADSVIKLGQNLG